MVWPCVRALAGALLRVSAATTRTSSSSSSAGGEQQQQEQQAAAAAGVPAHVAFIMDGNRRFADTHSLLRIDGHKQGYNRMKAVIQWCFELGVTTVSVYAFSIDNFKRPQSEVDALMELAAAKFDELAQDEDARQWGAEVRVIGDLSLAPPALQAAAARLMRSSKAAAAAAAAAGGSNRASSSGGGGGGWWGTQQQQQQPSSVWRQQAAHGGGVLCSSAGGGGGGGADAGSSSSSGGGGGRRVVNICFSYTSSQELAAAAGQLAGGLAESELLPGDVTPSLLHRVMHTQDCPPVDLLIRTSGEQRLSDFMLWQCSHALLHWEPVLWPQFGFAHLLRALLAWRDAAPTLAALRYAAAADLAAMEASGRQQELLLAGGSCSDSGAASPPVLLPYGGGGWQQQQQQQPAAGGGGGQQQQQQWQAQWQAWQQEDTKRVLDQLQRSSEVLAELQRQQQQQQQQQLWWPGQLFGGSPPRSSPSSGNGRSGSGSGSSSSSSLGLYPKAALAALASGSSGGAGSSSAGAPAGRSPERASSATLSVISEGEAAHAPHPWQPLRLQGWLRRLDLEREQGLAELAGDDGSAAGDGG